MFYIIYLLYTRNKPLIIYHMLLRMEHNFSAMEEQRFKCKDYNCPENVIKNVILYCYTKGYTRYKFPEF